jgi:hypothetical protein
MKLSIILPVALLISTFRITAGEATPKEKAQAEYVNRLIAKLLADDPQERDDATTRLKATQPVSNRLMRQAQAQSKDPEQLDRLKRLLQRYPLREPRAEPDVAPRKEITQAAIDAILDARDDKAWHKMIRGLYDEFTAGPRADRAGIARDFAKLMPGAMEAVREFQPVEIKLGNGPSMKIGPSDLIEQALGPYRRAGEIKSMKFLSRELLKKVEPVEALASSERPPDPKDWDRLRHALKETLADLHDAAAEKPHLEELVSMIFINASLPDVISTIAIQSEEFLFFDPPELSAKIVELTTSCRIEDVPWSEALTQVLAPHGLTFKYQVTGEPGIHIMRKE